MGLRGIRLVCHCEADIVLTVRLCQDKEQSALLRIINAAAQRYRGVIPDDCWHEPYMRVDELAHEMAAGVTFWGAELDAALVGVMGMQQVLDVALIRHAYVAPEVQGRGLGGLLLRRLCAQEPRSILVGTWAAATWAIRFYERYGFCRTANDETASLLRKYWSVPERQIETSVVLRKL
jgi:GNAT superfamily N-acetyltransferase